MRLYNGAKLKREMRESLHEKEKKAGCCSSILQDLSKAITPCLKCKDGDGDDSDDDDDEDIKKTVSFESIFKSAKKKEKKNLD